MFYYPGTTGILDFLQALLGFRSTTHYLSTTVYFLAVILLDETKEMNCGVAAVTLYVHTHTWLKCAKLSTVRAFVCTNSSTYLQQPFHVV